MNIAALVRQLATYFPLRAETTAAWTSFTPTLAGTGTAGTFTYTTRAGRYLVTGKSVSFSLRITITAITVAPTGTMLISGLPIAGYSAGYQAAAVGYALLTMPAGGLQFGAVVPQSLSQINLYYFSSAGATAYPAASLNANADLIISGRYETS